MSPDRHTPDPQARFRTTLIRVLVVQAVSMLLLGLLQILYRA